ncbi:GTP pyrophosphokinase [Lacinutrix sp. MEBiC02404]
MDDNKLKPFETEFLIAKPNLIKFKDSLVIQIEQLLESNEIALGFPIQNRTKEWNSISDKVKSGRFSFKKSIFEMQDLVGLRVILLFKPDAEKACNLIETNLNVIRKYDTISRLKEDQFGYSSIHFVISIPKEWAKVPTFSNMEDYKAEIQIRTLSQHTWAEASKELQYKNEENVPRPLLRSIGRVSALLETVDFEFERLLVERSNYLKTLTKELNTTNTVKLNVDNLKAIIDEILPENNKDEDESYSELLQELNYFGVQYTSKLIVFLKENIKEAIKIDKKIVSEIKRKKNKPDSLETLEYFYEPDRLNLGVYYTHTGLIRQIFQNVFPKKWEKFKNRNWNPEE